MSLVQSVRSSRLTLPLPWHLPSIKVTHYTDLFERSACHRCVWTFVSNPFRGDPCINCQAQVPEVLNVGLDSLCQIWMADYVYQCSATLPLSCQINMTPISSGLHIGISIYTCYLSSANTLRRPSLGALLIQQVIKPYQPVSPWERHHGEMLMRVTLVKPFEPTWTQEEEAVRGGSLKVTGCFVCFKGLRADCQTQGQ